MEVGGERKGVGIFFFDDWSVERPERALFLCFEWFEMVGIWKDG